MSMNFKKTFGVLFRAHCSVCVFPSLYALLIKTLTLTSQLMIGNFGQIKSSLVGYEKSLLQVNELDKKMVMLGNNSKA